MDRTARVNLEPAEPAFSPVETVAGPLDAGVLLVCDHASNAIPPGYGSLGLKREALERHIAYDIGAAELDPGARGAAQRARGALDLFAPPHRSEPRRRRSDPRHALFRRRDRARQRADRRGRDRRPARALLGALPADDRRRRSRRCSRPASRRLSSRSTPSRPSGAGAPRRWKVGVLWDRDDRIAKPLLEALHAEPDLHAHGIGDNEPYDGALAGDTIDAVATARGLANALIEIRQDLIAEPAGALAWAERLARLLKPILADARRRAPRDFGSRARAGAEGLRRISRQLTPAGEISGRWAPKTVTLAARIITATPPASSARRGRESKLSGRLSKPGGRKSK